MARTQVQTELIATNAISGTIIADNAITSVHIATNSISGVLVQDSGVTTTMIAANNITAAKIVSDGVETRHLHSNVVSGLSAVTAASGDYVLVGDTSDSNNLKKALVSDLGNSLANNTNNYVVTATGSGLNGEANLTFDGSTLTVTGEVSMTTLDIGGTNVTSTAAELNILDGVTSTAAELNILDGVTSTAAELNYVDGVTSAIQTQMDTKASTGKAIAMAMVFG